MNSVAYAEKSENLFLVNPGSKVRRAKFDHKLNETSSVVDRVFDGMRKRAVTQQEITQLKSSDYLINQSEEMIKDHIDKRVALFFQQLIVCYQVPFQFEMGDTQHQAPSAPTLKKRQGTESVAIPFNSAHSATIPCLYAYHKADYDHWEANPDSVEKPTAFVYLKGSDTYKSHNATIELIKLVNSADISLDGTSSSTDQLRIKSIDLINRAARGQLSPQDGLKRFLQESKRILEEKIAAGATKPEIRKILAIYLERVNNALEEIKDPSYFDQLVNVNINQESEEASQLRQLIYRRRFKIIRESQETQSVIAKKIHVLSVDILGIGRRPANFNNVMKKKILTLCTSTTEKRQLTRLFNVSLEQITHDLQGKRYRTAENRINSQVHREKFSKLMREMRAECRSLTNREYTYRAEVTRDLRNHKRWRQVDLVKEYRKVYADGPMSQPTVSRLENTIKMIDRQLAHRLASIYGVDRGFYFPAIFTSS